MRTPWGESDSVRPIAPGIVWVTTPGHGGLGISTSYNISTAAFRYAYWQTHCNMYWFEEDCAWAVGVLDLVDRGITDIDTICLKLGLGKSGPAPNYDFTPYTGEQLFDEAGRTVSRWCAAYLIETGREDLLDADGWKWWVEQIAPLDNPHRRAG